jgi:cytochrome c553
MKTPFAWLTVFLAAALMTVRFGAAADAPPSWAFPLVVPGGPAAPADDGTAKRLPGTGVTFLLAQTRDGFNVPDWRPDEHPPMPDIVSRGRRPDVRGCGYCHLPNGFGRPENASLAGLPAQYIEQQMADYKRGVRKSSEPKMGPPAAMLGIGKAANEDEVKIAAAYFASIKPKPWIRVVEAATVPKSRVVGSMYVPLEEGGTEPIGVRIVEMPENRERTELRDAASPFVAYAPVGSVKKGEALVMTGGGGKTIRCTICHGEELKGLGPVPALAGRSPSYIARQMWDMQHGNRAGLGAELMKASLAKLTEEDMVNIAAFTSSRMP